MTEVHQPTPPEAQAFKAPVSKPENLISPQVALERNPGFWALLTGAAEGSKPSEHLAKAGELYEQWGTGADRLENFAIGWQTGTEAAHAFTSTLETYWANLIAARDPAQQPYQAPTHEAYAARREERESRIDELRAKLEGTTTTPKDPLASGFSMWDVELPAAEPGADHYFTRREDGTPVKMPQPRVEYKYE